MKKKNIDIVILLILVIVGSIVIGIKVGTTRDTYYLNFVGLLLGFGILYIPISGLIRKKIIFSFGRYISFKEKPRDFIIGFIFYLIIAIIIMYSSLKLLLLK